MDNKERRKESNMPGIHEGAQREKEEAGGREVERGSGGRTEPGGCEQERERQ